MNSFFFPWKCITGSHLRNCYWNLLTSLLHPPQCDSWYPLRHYLVLQLSCEFHQMDAKQTGSAVMQEALKHHHSLFQTRTAMTLTSRKSFTQLMERQRYVEHGTFFLKGMPSKNPILNYKTLRRIWQKWWKDFQIMISSTVSRFNSDACTVSKPQYNEYTKST